MSSEFVALRLADAVLELRECQRRIRRWGEAADKERAERLGIECEALAKAAKSDRAEAIPAARPVAP